MTLPKRGAKIFLFYRCDIRPALEVAPPARLGTLDPILLYSLTKQIVYKAVYTKYSDRVGDLGMKNKKLYMPKLCFVFLSPKTKGQS